MIFILITFSAFFLLYKVICFLYLITKQQSQFLNNERYAKISPLALIGVLLSAVTSYYLFFSNIDYYYLAELVLVKLGSSILPTQYYLSVLKVVHFSSGLVPFLLIMLFDFLLFFIVNKSLAGKGEIENGGKIIYAFFLGAQIIPVTLILPAFYYINNFFGNIVWPQTKGVTVLLVIVMSVLVSFSLFLMSNEETKKRTYEKVFYAIFACYFIFLMTSTVVGILKYQS